MSRLDHLLPGFIHVNRPNIQEVCGDTRAANGPEHQPSSEVWRSQPRILPKSSNVFAGALCTCLQWCLDPSSRALSCCGTARFTERQSMSDFWPVCSSSKDKEMKGNTEEQKTRLT